jgi:NTE family protein
MDTRALAARPGRLPVALGAALVLCTQAQGQPAPTPAASQAPLPDGQRPKICLVLSGGGARGAAHVGVLKVLEELRVPIDCITGTSMGSIVGGAYASGIPIGDMEATLGSMSKRLLFKDLPPREERATRLKRDDATNLAPAEIGLRDGDVLLPKGLVSGVQLESVLRRMSKVRGFHRFDDLPIPFRAVATDLVTGKPVVLSQGELAGAMRASMSVPGAIAPVRLEDRLLVDGGLTDNLPVGVARAMGADIVIAVNLGTPLLKADQLTSVLGVTDQMVSILTEQNVQASLASLKPTDILIRPQLGDFSAADFDHLPETVPIGEAAARAVADLLARLSVPQAQYDAWRSRRLAGPTPVLPTVDEIRFGKLERVNPDIARSTLRIKPGVPLDQEALDRDLRRLYGTGDFESVNYQLLEEPGKRILAVEAAEKSWGPNYLRLGLGLVTDFRGDAYFNLLASYRMTWLNQLGGEWRNDVQFGRTNRISTEFYQPVEASQTFFVVPRAAHERRATDVFQGDQRIARYDIVTTTASVEGGAQFTRYGEMRLGIEHAGVKSVLDTGPAFLVATEGRQSYTSLTLRGIVDQLDNVNFPRSGYAGSFNLKSSRAAWGSDASFTRGEMTAVAYKSVGEHTFSAAFRFTGRLGSDPLPATQLFQWGGLLQQSGYPTGALLGEELMFARLVYLKRLAHWSLLDGIYAGVSLEVGRMRRPLIPDNEQGILRSMAILFGLDTPVGPLYLGYGHADHGFDSLYLFLGKP